MERGIGEVEARVEGGAGEGGSEPPGRTWPSPRDLKLMPWEVAREALGAGWLHRRAVAELSTGRSQSRGDGPG